MPDEEKPASAPEDHDIVIVGGGAAGLAAAVYAGRAGRDTLLLERKFLGGQVALADHNANYPGFPDGVDGPQLVQLMEKQATRYGTRIEYAEVTGLDVADRLKVVHTANKDYRAPIVIVATGADPRMLEVPGEWRLRGKGVSYCGTCDGPFFRNKRLAVVGGGDSALKEALFLANLASSLTIIHRRDALRAEKIYQDRARENPRISFVWDTVVEEILGQERVEAVAIRNVKTGETRRLEIDGVFIFVGSLPNTGFVASLFCESIDSGCHVPTNADMETSVRGIYAVGDVRQHSYRQIATAVGEGVTAAIAAEHLLAEWGYQPGQMSNGECQVSSGE
jgi:thioredoxin reductase (NADPH)